MVASSPGLSGVAPPRSRPAAAWLRRRPRWARLSCRELVELVTAHLEGSLDPRTSRRVAAHLAHCVGCTTYVAQTRELVRALGMLPDPPLPQEQCDELVAAFRTARLSPGPGRPRS